MILFIMFLFSKCARLDCNKMLQSFKRNDLSLLIQAAEYVENQSKTDSFDQDHGYAMSSFSVGTEPLQPKIKAMRKGHNRTSHNELEKNRRAHLRSCLDNLKAIVPLRDDSTRHTTLGLLNQARALVLTLKEEYSSLNQVKVQEHQRNAMLKRTLFQIQTSRKRTNSTGSAWSSGHSESSTDSDKDDEIIDVTDCSEEISVLKTTGVPRPTNLITISVPKALTLPSRLAKHSRKAEQK